MKCKIKEKNKKKHYISRNLRHIHLSPSSRIYIHTVVRPSKETNGRTKINAILCYGMRALGL